MMQMNDGEEAVGGESPKEQALPALPVIDKLAAYGAVHSLGELFLDRKSAMAASPR